MTKRDIIILVLVGRVPLYVSWSFKFTKEPYELLRKNFGTNNLDIPLQNHILMLGSDIGFFDDLGNNLVQDVFDVVWDRSIDKETIAPMLEGAVRLLMLTRDREYLKIAEDADSYFNHYLEI